jgi:hypothetical protein
VCVSDSLTTRSVNFGTSGALLHRPPSSEYQPLAAALAQTHTPLLVASRSTRGAALLSGTDVTMPRLRVSSGFSVTTLRGEAEGVAVAAASHRPTAVGSDVALVAGKWCYEVRVTRAGRACVGWGDGTCFGLWSAGRGVGDDAHSVGFGTAEGKTGGGVVTASRWHPCSRKWSYGDVVSVGIDVDAGTVTFALNGAVETPSVAVPRFAFEGWVCPALSFNADFSAVVNFGDAPLAFPLPGFEPVAKALV